MIIVLTSIVMGFNVALGYYLKTKATMLETWPELFKFIFHPGIIIFFGLVGPLNLWSMTKLQYDNSGKDIWLTTVLYSFIVAIATIFGVWLSSGQRPTSKDIISILLMGIIVIWRSVG